MSKNQEVIYDIGNRIIQFNGYVNKENSQQIIYVLKSMERDEARDDIDFYINSYGGSVDELFAIYDIIRTLKCKVNTYALGCCASAAAKLIMIGTGKRYAYKNSRIMLHELSSWIGGKMNEIETDYNEIKRQHEQIIDLIVNHTKQDKGKVKKNIEKDFYLTPQQALEYGIIDEVI